MDPAKGDDGVAGVFLHCGEIDDNSVNLVGKEFAEHKDSILQSDAYVTDVTSLFVALGKAPEALAIRLMWGITNLRVQYVLLATALRAIDVTKLSVPADSFVEAWAALSDGVNNVVRLWANSAAAEAAFGADALGSLELPQVPFANFRVEIQRALQISRELLVTSTARVSGVIQRAGESLLSQIPRYEAYVCKTFDVEQCKAELVSKSWDTFADQWVKLQKVMNIAKSLSSSAVCTEDSSEGNGRFELVYANSVSVTQRALLAGRTFVAVASTVKLILETLPAETKASSRGGSKAKGASSRAGVERPSDPVKLQPSMGAAAGTVARSLKFMPTLALTSEAQLTWQASNPSAIIARRSASSFWRSRCPRCRAPTCR